MMGRDGVMEKSASRAFDQLHSPQGVFQATADERVEVGAAASVTRVATAKFNTALPVILNHSSNKLSCSRSRVCRLSMANLYTSGFAHKKELWS